MSIVETWLCSDVLDNEVLIPNYSDLTEIDMGDGVAMYIHGSVAYYCMDLLI